MKIYLVAGANGALIKKHLEQDEYITVTNCEQLIAEVAKKFGDIVSNYDVLLLMDQGVSADLPAFEASIQIMLNYKAKTENRILVKFITKDSTLADVFNSLTDKHPKFETHLVDSVKVPLSFIREVCFKQPAAAEPSPNPTAGKNYFFKKPIGIKKGDARLSGSISIPFSESMRRVIAITGDRGSGITSTVANLAVLAGSIGLSTILIDLDTKNKGINLYFNRFGDTAERQTDLNYSLIKCLAMPDSYSRYAYKISSKLSLIALTYNVSSKDDLLNTVTVKRLIALLSALRLENQLILIDLPLWFLKESPELIIQFDRIGICIPNSLYAITSSVNCIVDAFSPDDLLLFRMKSKAIISKYNKAHRHDNRILSPQTTLSIANCLHNSFELQQEFAGVVPYQEDFDLQVDTGKKICMVNEVYNKHYLSLLANLI